MLARKRQAARSQFVRCQHRRPRHPLGFDMLESRNLLSTTPLSLSFSNTPLLTETGNSEPEISIGNDGNTAAVALDWTNPASNLWTGKFGDTLQPRGSLDFLNPALQVPGKVVVGGGDVDVDVGSTGTIHATSLVYLRLPAIMPPKRGTYIGPLRAATPPPAEGRRCSSLTRRRGLWA